MKFLLSLDLCTDWMMYISSTNRSWSNLGIKTRITFSSSQTSTFFANFVVLKVATNNHHAINLYYYQLLTNFHHLASPLKSKDHIRWYYCSKSLSSHSLGLQVNRIRVWGFSIFYRKIGIFSTFFDDGFGIVKPTSIQ